MGKAYIGAGDMKHQLSPHAFPCGHHRMSKGVGMEAGNRKHWGIENLKAGNRNTGSLSEGWTVLHPLLFFKDFIYLFLRDRERERQRYRQREKQTPCREPDVGLDPWTPGSCPAQRQALNH